MQRSMASGKVTNRLMQKYDQPSMQERVQVNPVKLPWKMLRSTRVDPNITSLIEAMYDKVECAVVINYQLTEWFSVEIGVRQG